MSAVANTVQAQQRHLYLGHPYRRTDGVAYGVELDAARTDEALRESLAVEKRVGTAAHRCLCAGPRETDSAYSPLAAVTGELGYRGTPSSNHLPVGRPVTHKTYRDGAHQSRLVLPITTCTEGRNG